MEKYYPYIRRLIHKLRLERILDRDKGTKEAVEILYRCQDKKKIWEVIWCQRIMLILAAVIVSVLFLLISMTEDEPDRVIQDGRIIKNNSDEVTFGVRAQTGEDTLEREITVELRTEEEQNQPPEETSVPQTEALMAQIQERVQEAVEQQRDLEQIILPETVSGNRVEYLNLEKKKDYSAFILSLAIFPALPLLWKHQRQQMLQQREEQLILDYPELINKVLLLLSAGLTIRGCFERISSEYKKRLEEGGGRRYVYEEISVSCQEMKNGVSEAEAIEAFGTRCRQIPYLKFASVVNQNIRKGSEGMTAILELEAVEAFEKRKETVKRMGETAGTKLLLPMILMLGVVMVIILVPAFMTM
ncbi:MAG: type II secretion system F family protein [Eubacterium sp.]|nr:type II secretion system F family protein [Eubacterium sp.]